MSFDFEKRLEIFDDLTKDIVKSDFRNWLIQNGFFNAPASTKYHLAYDGGLFEHSYNVTKELIRLTNKLDLKWERNESPIIVGMFHDLCKHDQYIYNNETKTYSWNNNQPILGHGDKSVKILLKYMTLSNEEKICIEQHMGSFSDKSKWTGYTDGIKLYPNVLYTHVADITASHILEKQKNF